MSTKTTFKRIALVAVAAMGFGVLTSVAPVSAATGIGLTPTALNIGTIPTAQVGVNHKTPISVVVAAAALAAGGSDTITVNVRVTSAPAGSAYRTLANQSKKADGTTAGNLVDPTFAAGNNVPAQIGFTAVSGGIVQGADLATDLMTVGTNFYTSAKTAAGTFGTLSADITPDIAGIRFVPFVSPLTVFPKSPKTLRKVLKPYGVDIHSLRHTYVYLLKQQGVHVTTAQRLPGHSDPRVTMSVDSQVLDM